jgi:hypothetical protein
MGARSFSQNDSAVAEPQLGPLQSNHTMGLARQSSTRQLWRARSDAGSGYQGDYQGGAAAGGAGRLAPWGLLGLPSGQGAPLADPYLDPKSYSNKYAEQWGLPTTTGGSLSRQNSQQLVRGGSGAATPLHASPRISTMGSRPCSRALSDADSLQECNSQIDSYPDGKRVALSSPPVFLRSRQGSQQLDYPQQNAHFRLQQLQQQAAAAKEMSPAVAAARQAMAAAVGQRAGPTPKQAYAAAAVAMNAAADRGIQQQHPHGYGLSGDAGGFGSYEHGGYHAPTFSYQEQHDGSTGRVRAQWQVPQDSHGSGWGGYPDGSSATTYATAPTESEGSYRSGGMAAPGGRVVTAVDLAKHTAAMKRQPSNSYGAAGRYATMGEGSQSSTGGTPRTPHFTDDIKSGNFQLKKVDKEESAAQGPMQGGGLEKGGSRGLAQLVSYSGAEQQGW